MIDVGELLVEAYELGATFTLGEGDRIKVQAPAPLPDELMEELKAHKWELRALLQEPHIDATGSLVIPFTSSEKYCWWKGGQQILETLSELGASDEVVRRYDWTELVQTEEDTGLNQPPPPPCQSCGGVLFWMSIAHTKAVICAKCHPPASPDVVWKWIEGGGSS